MRGRLWWIADDVTELANWKTLYLNDPDVMVIKEARLPKNSDRVQLIIEIERADAERLLGYTPENIEWLEN